MFWFLRAALVIGVIFYLSPVRHAVERRESQAGHPGSRLVERMLAAPGPVSERDWAQVEKLWATLPAPAKAALLDRFREAAREGRLPLAREEQGRASEAARADERPSGGRGDQRARLPTP